MQILKELVSKLLLSKRKFSIVKSEPGKVGNRRGIGMTEESGREVYLLLFV